MVLQKIKQQRLIIISLSLLACTYIFGLLLSGVRHEEKKFKTLLVAIALVLLFHHVIADILRFICQALYASLCQTTPKKATVSATPNSTQTPVNRTEFLILRLNSIKSKSFISSKHYQEPLNLRYKLIAKELFIYVKYFVLLLLLIVGSRNTLCYHNTEVLEVVIKNGRISGFGLINIIEINDFYSFAEHNLIKAFNDPIDYDGLSIPEPGWINYQMAKLMGVVRLRQVRHAEEASLRRLDFATQDFMPQWNLPFQTMHYMNKYWRIYEPWMSKSDVGFESWLVKSQHHGYLYTYAEDNGYVALLARNYQNSMKVLHFLHDSEWLDNRTAALFVDFTLYNVDSNVFTICNILVEQTPFGTILYSTDVQSAELLLNLNQVSYLALLIILLYILQLIQFSKLLALKAWYTPHELRSSWNILDMVIILFNFVVVFLICCREATVSELMQRFDNSKKLEFVDFRIPAQIDYLTMIFVGFLICATTIRIWKLLQFAGTFRMFTGILSSARIDLSSAMLFIITILVAFGIGSYIINGNNTEHFTRIMKSITSSISYAIGFSHEVSYMDLEYGGFALGFVLYVILNVAVKVVLINMFITVILDHFARMQEVREVEDAAINLSFGEFLRVEFASFWNYFKCYRPSRYRRNNATVRENIDQELDRMDQTKAQSMQTKPLGVQPNEEVVDAQELEMKQTQKMDRLRQVALMLETQLEIIKRELEHLELEVNKQEKAHNENKQNASKNWTYEKKRYLFCEVIKSCI